MQTCEQLLQQCSSVSVKARLRRACVESSSAWTTKCQVLVIRPRPFLPKVVKYSKIHVRISGKLSASSLAIAEVGYIFHSAGLFWRRGIPQLARSTIGLGSPTKPSTKSTKNIQKHPKTMTEVFRCMSNFNSIPALRSKQTHYDPFASIRHFLSRHHCFSMLFCFCLGILSWLFRLVVWAQTQLGLNHWDPICHDRTLHIHRKIKIVQDAEMKRRRWHLSVSGGFTVRLREVSLVHNLRVQTVSMTNDSASDFRFRKGSVAPLGLILPNDLFKILS